MNEISDEFTLANERVHWGIFIPAIFALFFQSLNRSSGGCFVTALWQSPALVALSSLCDISALRKNFMPRSKLPLSLPRSKSRSPPRYQTQASSHFKKSKDIKAAETSNKENLLVIDESTLAKYTANWKAHLEHSEPYTDTKGTMSDTRPKRRR